MQALWIFLKVYIVLGIKGDFVFDSEPGEIKLEDWILFFDDGFYAVLDVAQFSFVGTWNIAGKGKFKREFESISHIWGIFIIAWNAQQKFGYKRK